MVCERFVNQDSLVHRLDPRVRMVGTVLFTVPAALLTQWEALAVCLTVALIAAAAAHLAIRHLITRFVILNVFVLMLILTLAFTGGRHDLNLAGMHLSRSGLTEGLRIGLKANTILLATTAFLSTIRMVRLGHAMSSLGIPLKFAHLFLFTVRYLDLMHHELHRLQSAMTARAFRPRPSWLTLRAYGYLVGMLLVRSYERSERVLEAMRCRGFTGQFHSLEGLCYGARDAVFLAALFSSLTLAVVLEFIV